MADETDPIERLVTANIKTIETVKGSINEFRRLIDEFRRVKKSVIISGIITIIILNIVAIVAVSINANNMAKNRKIIIENQDKILDKQMRIIDLLRRDE